MRKFNLTEKEKETLLKWGYQEKELPQIEDAANMGLYETNKGKSVSWVTAKRIVGGAEFLSGIARAAFHWTASRENSRGIRVYFDFSGYFKD